MKLVIAAGGTGGHLFPGIAVAKKFCELDPKNEVVFIGSERGLEAEIVTNAGFRHETLQVGRLKGEGMLKKIKTLFQLPISLWEAKKRLDRLAPQLVFGIGGYSSGPVVIAAWLKRIPRAILEPNSIPGLTNRMLARWVQRIFVAFPETEVFFPEKKVRLTGTPVREELHVGALLAAPGARQVTEGNPCGTLPLQFTLLVLGGSQGSHSLNEAMIRILPEIEKSGKNFKIIHQTGEKDFEKVRTAYEASKILHEVTAFRKDMESAYRQADLVVSRSGASTVAELIETRSPSILVPYPFAADDHQTFNASSLVKRGGTEMMSDGELQEKLLGRILNYADHPEHLQTMREALAKASPLPATDVVMQECLALMMGKAA